MSSYNTQADRKTDGYEPPPIPLPGGLAWHKDSDWLGGNWEVRVATPRGGLVGYISRTRGGGFEAHVFLGEDPRTDPARFSSAIYESEIEAAQHLGLCLGSL